MDYPTNTIRPFDSFSVVYKVLVWTGFYKLLDKPKSRNKQLLHQAYRVIVIFVITVFALQHVLFAIQVRHNMEKAIDCLMIGIPQMNLLTKLIMMYYKTPKISEINEFLKDGEFSALNEQDEKFLKENKRDMLRLSKIIYIDISLASIFWPLTTIIRRYYDENEGVHIYTPYKTDTWPRFFISLFNEAGLMFWVGYGHLSIDVLIASYYSQAQTQLKMIKEYLVCLLDDGPTNEYLTEHFEYKDLSDGNVKKRFICIVKRYDKLVWYINEVNSIFNVSLSVQFLTSSLAVCLVIYRMTMINIISLTFLFLLIVICTLLMQVFMYCYYGNLVEYESDSVNTSLYSSDWLSLSPSFRRQLLIAMCRWSHPLRPTVGGIIPLSLTTFISIVRSSYTLYTALITTKVGN